MKATSQARKARSVPADLVSSEQVEETTVGQRLRILRGVRTQRDFASYIGINKSSLGRYERAECYPDVGDLQKLCLKLDVNPYWLLFGGDHPIYKRGSKRQNTANKNYDTVMYMLAEESKARRELEQMIRELMDAVTELKGTVNLSSGQ